MLLSYKKGIVNFNGLHTYSYKEYTYYYSGIIWMTGKKTGEETVLQIAVIFEETGVIPFARIFGSFYCIIKKPDGEIILFTDNSNMHCFFIGDKALGTDFLETVRENGTYSFDKDALCEFIDLGNVYFGKTPVENIKLSSSDKYYIFNRNTLKTKDKKIGNIDDKSSVTDVNEFFREMAYSLSDMKLTMSLTGGYDSRMVFSCLREYVPVDIFISGNNRRDDDIVCAQKAAAAAGSRIEVIKSQKPEMTEQYIAFLFECAQGIVPFANDGFIRVNDFIRNRSMLGYDCYLSGDGGVLHKDWWWLQDLPCYRRKLTDFSKFYYQRIRFSDEKVPWGSLLKKNAAGLDKRMINELKNYRMPLNTQTYDSLYFNVNGKKTSVNYSIHSKYIYSYAPLWELELVKYSYHLPRRQRFFYNSIRHITTKASVNIARVPTNYGTTASCELLYICRDVFFQGIDYFKKACRMLGRKFFNRSFFIGNTVTWSVENDLRESPITQRSLDYAVNAGILDRSAKKDDMSFALIGRLLQVYLLSEYMKNSLSNETQQDLYAVGRE